MTSWKRDPTIATGRAISKMPNLAASRFQPIHFYQYKARDSNLQTTNFLNDHVNKRWQLCDGLMCSSGSNVETTTHFQIWITLPLFQKLAHNMVIQATNWPWGVSGYLDIRHLMYERQDVENILLVQQFIWLVLGCIDVDRSVQKLYLKRSLIFTKYIFCIRLYIVFEH